MTRLLGTRALALSVLVALAATFYAGAIAEARHPHQFSPLPGPGNVQWVIPDPSFTPLAGARALSGTYSGGAYRIEVPSNWNGELVLYAHGFRGSPPELTVSNPPIRSHLIENGYAWAASSYRNNGYVPGVGAQDTLALKDLFTRLVGRPSRTYLYGTSMGGHVAMISAEFYPEAYDGILSECGVVAGYELFDFFTASAAAAEFLTGSDYRTGGSAETARIVSRLGTVAAPTQAGRQLASVMINISGGPRPFAIEGLAQFRDTDIGAGATALFDPTASPVAMAATNSATNYTIAPGLGLTNAQLGGIRRKAADPSFRNRSGPYAELAPFTGEIRVPVMQIKTTGDLFVPIVLEQRYLEIAKQAGTSHLLVQRAIRAAGHCTFMNAEQVRAFDDLVRWVKYGIKPEGDDLSGDLRDVGRKFTSQLRPGDPGTLGP
ncbi:MAG TPA: alpha/beta hydrolase [Dehalococcoidia bacterium]|nr:alpha/beta hydrolase [Dehalococcoidia bacterium]